MSEKHDEGDDLIQFKIITLGDNGVGKTEIIKRFLNNNSENKTISGTKIKLKLIDTAGQENYQALASTYIKNADGVLFVFALNNQDSFHNIKKWLDNFKENNKAIDFNKTILAYLVGTKSNLEHKISKEEIEELKKENNFYGFLK